MSVPLTIAVKIYAAELNQRITNTSLKVTGLAGQIEPSRKDGPNAATARYAVKNGRFARTYLQAVAKHNRRRHQRN